MCPLLVILPINRLLVAVDVNESRDEYQLAAAIAVCMRRPPSQRVSGHHCWLVSRTVGQRSVVSWSVTRLAGRAFAAEIQFRKTYGNKFTGTRLALFEGAESESSPGKFREGRSLGRFRGHTSPHKQMKKKNISAQRREVTNCRPHTSDHTRRSINCPLEHDVNQV